ncbi:MAG TPA: phosphatase PAP2 family protein [Candidatus Binatus sp.]|jgi:membrane-associated phospholipid phosphatase|nr:phosphatase PAP2 family protein [Candidatus Binatus sp.]
MQLTGAPGPFLPDWNFRVLQRLFLLFPHSGVRDSLAQFLTVNALASTWIFAAVFYLYWRIEDQRTALRRSQLVEIFVCFCLAIVTTLVWRPWIAWPAPSLLPRFRILYPDYFWAEGNLNCFPSHSTLIYLIVAVGLWRLNRWLSMLLMFWVLFVISLPRIYVGGHYPIDVLAAILLAAVAVWATRQICATARVSELLTRIIWKKTPLEFFLFLWLFELAEGFRSSYVIALSFARAARSIW